MKDGGKISAWVWSLLVHVAIAGGFIASVRIALPPAQVPQGEVIQAVAIDADALRAREQARIEAERRAEEARQAELRRQREAAEAQRRREEEARQAELRRQEEQRRKAAEAEARRKAEAEEARRRAAEEEARRKAEAERRRREEEARRQREAEEAARRAREAELRQQLEAEEQRFAAIRSGKQAQWVGAITNKVMRNWSPPANLGAQFYCEFQVRQIPGGEVVSVENIRCDNDVLRRSAEAAIWRASPLPPPPDPSLFDQYITVKFQPED